MNDATERKIITRTLSLPDTRLSTPDTLIRAEYVSRRRNQTLRRHGVFLERVQTAVMRAFLFFGPECCSC